MQTVIRNSYRAHYRRMLPRLLGALEFRSNNEAHRPVIRAIELLKRYADSKVHAYPPEEDVPLDGVVRGPWRDAVIEPDQEDGGKSKVNRIT